MFGPEAPPRGVRFAEGGWGGGGWFGVPAVAAAAAPAAAPPAAVVLLRGLTVNASANRFRRSQARSASSWACRSSSHTAVGKTASARGMPRLMQYRVVGGSASPFESEVEVVGPVGTTVCTNPTATKICNTSSNTADDDEDDDGVGLVTGAGGAGGLGRGSGGAGTSEVGTTCCAPGIGAGGWVGRTVVARSWPRGGGASIPAAGNGTVVDEDVVVDKTSGGMLYSI